jgi:uncharacterized protein
MSATADRRTIAVNADSVSSPCISVCVMDEASGLCTGCFRTLDEIAAWSVLDEMAKREVLAALPGRRSVKWPPG